MTTRKEEGAAGSSRSVHWFVSGRVQGVGFRYYVQDAARRHGVNGDVRNLPDGRVELRARGGNLEQFLSEVRIGPHGARVDQVDARGPVEASEFDGFQIRF